MDGASRGNPGIAAAGGVLLDEHGTWICGFALNIGVWSAPLAELWGVYYGLCMAWEQRVQRDWIVRVVHVYREANRVADGLANHAFSLSLGFHFFPSSPFDILELVKEDALGSTRTRFVRPG
ncbi:unnamed protein product [Microthlaspi erraticum]|uniref:RNase H type-1 domain-containing protein n=1 Tax=Microthlaspi erraticum TaxID=1685480 RepID=A0A6D2HQ60_9BRAS|nr:unnamed protein product [Microthlaspi erraticum]